MIINDTITAANALADIAQGIARDLRNGHRISRLQIRNRIADYFDDAPLTDDALDAYTAQIARHPAIRTRLA